MTEGFVPKYATPRWLRAPYVLAGLAVVIGLIYLTDSTPPFSNPHIRAAPFVWPNGCPARYYEEYDVIPIACAVEENRLKEARSYGFIWSSVGSTRGDAAEYYRLANDAIQIECRHKIMERDKTCKVGFRYRSIFAVDK